MAGERMRAQPPFAPAGSARARDVLVDQAPLRRPAAVTIMAVLHFLGAAGALIVGLLLMTGGAFAREAGGPFIVVFGVVVAGIGALQLACGMGLWGLKSYGRMLQIVFAAIGLIGFPIGTIIGVVVLVYLNKPGVKLLFSERPPSDFTPAERMQISTDGQSTAVLVTIVLALVAVPAFVGIVSAIAIPGLLRARQSGNEASAIGALRAVNSAEVTFAVSCGQNGYAQSLEDLGRAPTSGGGAFISPDLSIDGVEKSGYVITVRADAGATTVAPAAATCNGSRQAAMSAYFAEAHPATPGVTGARSFATDTRGTIYYRTDGRAIEPGMAGARVLE
jgi:hypothetical protein